MNTSDQTNLVVCLERSQTWWKQVKYFSLLFLFCAAAATAKDPELGYTPRHGSLERQAICDAARAFVLSKYTQATLPQPIVFKIEHISVQEPYCNFVAIPLFKDGSYVSADYIEDIAFNFCLKKTAGRWQIIFDLSRTDVPDEAEIKKIKSDFPSNFPLSLLSSTWRKLLHDSH